MGLTGRTHSRVPLTGASQGARVWEARGERRDRESEMWEHKSEISRLAERPAGGRERRKG